MSPLAVELFRRLSFLALILAGMLIVVPRALSELGVWGPGLDAQLGAVERSLEAARAYGGSTDDPAFHQAQDDLARARRLAGSGQTWSARQTIRHAGDEAVEAQRTALTARESSRRRAATVASEIDRRLNELEDLYTRVTREPGTGASEKTLLPLMKDARRSGASVLLLVEQGEYARALAMQADAVAALEGVRTTLSSYRTKDAAR